MQEDEIPTISNEDGLDVSEAEARFIDVDKHEMFSRIVVRVDGKMFDSYRSALAEVGDRIMELP
jgi:hypothetical protein